ncbi:hypothetical protein ACFLX4_00795 [Chloroflexota bacterium]
MRQKPVIAKRNNAKILESEYSAFRKEIIDYFEKNLLDDEPLTILDPMAGTAPLVPLIETRGHKAYFNDILPLHFFMNQAKTFRAFQYYQHYGYDRFLNELLGYMVPLKDKQLYISDKWIEDNILHDLVQSWNATAKCEELARIIIRAIILLCVRPLSSITKTKNATWPKFGGISSNKNIADIVAESLTRLDTYYKKHYEPLVRKRGECIFLNGNASEIQLPEKVDLIITSPPYCNRFDILRSYGPENYFLSAVGYSVQTTDVIGTNNVKDYESLDSDYDYLIHNSESALSLLGEMRKSKIRDDQTYYLKYYTRYFITLFHVVKRVLNNLSGNGRMYFVTQDNTHRGQLIEIDRILEELLDNIGWKSKIVDQWARHHLGLQNISRDSRVVRPKQFEKLVAVWQ